MVPPDHCKLVTLIAGSKWQSLLVAADDDGVFVTGSLNVRLKTTEQHLVVQSGKSEDELTNNGTVRSTYCTVEANY